MARPAYNEDAIAKKFIGTWRLIGVTRADPKTGANLDEGVAYDGVIAYTDDRRVTVVIARTAPGKPRFITSYAARWSLEPDYVTHHVDLGTEERREGTAQVRRYVFKDDILTLTPPVSRDFTGASTQRSLIWKRIPKPA